MVVVVCMYDECSKLGLECILVYVLDVGGLEGVVLVK